MWAAGGGEGESGGESSGAVIGEIPRWPGNPPMDNSPCVYHQDTPFVQQLHVVVKCVRSSTRVLGRRPVGACAPQKVVDVRS